MRATSERLLTGLAAAALALAWTVSSSRAHPMPNTEVTVSRGEHELNLVIRLPLSDLLLALPPQVPRNTKVLLGRNQPELRAYFGKHIRLLTRRGKAAPVVVGAIRLKRERDPNVGIYDELEVAAVARIEGTVPLTLAYDGVLHQVANHRALVRDSAGRPIGVIRYSLATKAAAPLQLPAAPVP